MKIKYFVITGMRRSGTTFLSRFLNEHPRALVQHEQPTSSWPKRFQAWVDAPSERFVGMVNSNARFYLKEIQEAVQPQWGFILREPLSLVRSCVAKKPGTQKFGQDNATRWAAIEALAGLDAALRRAKQLGLGMAMWSFDKIITPDGFDKISKWCGLDFGENSPDLEQVHATKDRQAYPPVDEWSDDLRNFVLDTVRSLPVLCNAYKEVGIVIQGEENERR